LALTTRDRYGGCPDIQLGATGFFRLERTDQRWWLVTPEGNAFLSFGINHVQTKHMMADYNAGHWAEKLGIAGVYDQEAFLPAFRQKVRDDMALLGANTLGCHSPQSYYVQSFMPYVCQMRFVDICHYMTPTEKEFWDVFSQEFETHCDARARETVLQRVDDPYLLGYSMTDCPVWTDLDAEPHEANIYGWKRIGLPTWPRVLRNLGGSSPGKRAYVETMRELYREDIDRFNETYGTTFPSFSALIEAESWRPKTDPVNRREERDNLAFLNKVVDKGYEVEKAAIRRYDPNHMIFGDKLNGNTDMTDDLIQIAAKHFDLIFYQYYALWGDQQVLLDRFARLTGKAILHGDSCCSVPDEHMPNPFGPHCADQQDRVFKFNDMFYNTYAQPDFVGWNWCGWMDLWEPAARPGKQHSGVQDAFGTFYPILEAMLKFSEEMYDLATKARF
jgi:agarase